MSTQLLFLFLLLWSTLWLTNSPSFVQQWTLLPIYNSLNNNNLYPPFCSISPHNTFYVNSAPPVPDSFNSGSKLHPTTPLLTSLGPSDDFTTYESTYSMMMTTGMAADCTYTLHCGDERFIPHDLHYSETLDVFLST